MPLPTCLLPTARPELGLLGMPESEFYDLFIGDDGAREFDQPDLQIIDAFYGLVAERAYALIQDWQHRETVIDVVSCFAPLASDTTALDQAIRETSAWLCGMGPRTALRAAGAEFEAAERARDATAEAMYEGDDIDGSLYLANMMAISHVNGLAETCVLHLVFGDVWVEISLLADRVRVVVELSEEGPVDMGGHLWDGDEDADADPATPPLETV